MPRLAPLYASMLSAVVLIACQEAAYEGTAGMGVTEVDTVACHTTESLYTNHTTQAKELHVRAENDCFGLDTLDLAQARLWVEDRNGRVVNRQDVQIDWGTTHRGTFSVPGGGSLKLECPEGLPNNAGCPWRYSYSLKP